MSLRIHVVVVLIVVAMVVSGCCRPILYKPATDPSSALLSVKIPETVSTLDGLPGDIRKTDMEWVERTGRQRPDVKERLELSMIWSREFETRHIESETNYNFILYFDEKDAKEDFRPRLDAFTTSPVKRPLFRKGQTDGREYYVSYIE